MNSSEKTLARIHISTRDRSTSRVQSRRVTMRAISDEKGTDEERKSSSKERSALFATDRCGKMDWIYNTES